VDASSGKRVLIRYRFDDSWNAVGSEVCESDIPELWHVDIMKDGGVLRGLFLSEAGGKGYRNSLYLVESKDNGSSFQRKAEIEIREDDIQLAYRASMIRLGKDFLMALTYRTKGSKWKLRFYRMDEYGRLSEEIGPY
jgi:hypothetical protein